MKEKLQEYALLAEIIGAAAIVISLIFVGFQVNQNSDEVRASNREQAVTRAQWATMSIALNTELAAIIAKVATGDELSETQQVQYSYFVRSMLYDLEVSYLLYLEGRLDAEYWQTRNALVLNYLSQPLAREIYEQGKLLGTINLRFSTFLDSQLE